MDAAPAVAALLSLDFGSEDLFHSGWTWLKVGTVPHISESHVVTFNFIVFVSASASDLLPNDWGEMKCRVFLLCTPSILTDVNDSTHSSLFWIIHKTPEKQRWGATKYKYFVTVS